MLKHGILGLLNYGDMTGYEIKEAFNNSLYFFWPVQTSQIYRELSVLEENKWISKQTVEQSSKPNKNICSITEQGRIELLNWLKNNDIDTYMRSSTLMKTFFMGELPTLNSLDYFRQLNNGYYKALENFEQIETSIALYKENISDKNKSIFWQMTADFGKRYTQMYIEWTQNCINILEKKEEK